MENGFEYDIEPPQVRSLFLKMAQIHRTSFNVDLAVWNSGLQLKLWEMFRVLGVSLKLAKHTGFGCVSLGLPYSYCLEAVVAGEKKGRGHKTRIAPETGSFIG
jgi:hypothetical protein